MKFNKFYYKPLPDYLTIKSSSIEGLGIFATKKIKSNTDLGMTHIKVPIIMGMYAHLLVDLLITQKILIVV